MICFGPGCGSTLTDSSASEYWCSPGCQARYDALQVDRLWEPNREVMSEQIKALISKAVSEGPDPLIDPTQRRAA